MRLVKLTCENTEEGRSYLAFNGYDPITRLTKTIWMVKRIGNKLDDVRVVA